MTRVSSVMRAGVLTLMALGACAAPLGPQDGATADAASDSGAGARCSRDDDCASVAGDVCLADPSAVPMDLAPRALRCGAARSDRASWGARCASDADCARGLCALAGTCVSPCASDDDCASGQVCTGVYTVTASAAMQPLRACVARLDLPPGVTASVRRADATATSSASVVRLDGVGPGAIASLTMIELSPDVPYAATRLIARDAARTVLYEPARSRSAPAPANAVAITYVPSTVLVPNGPNAVVTSEGYDLEVLARRVEHASLTTLSRAAPGATLDVNLFYVGLPSDLAPSGARPMGVDAALATLAAAYAPAGISLGEIREFRVVGALGDQLGVVDPDAEMSAPDPETMELFRLSAGAGRAAINYFLVRDGTAYNGQSGGAPGPHGANGTGASGIMISYETMMRSERGEARLGRSLTHELGHYLGLFHVSESTGVVIEPLPDTAECRIEHDTNRDGRLSPAECDGFGGDNVMFPGGADRAFVSLSPQQRAVVRRAMLLR